MSSPRIKLYRRLKSENIPVTDYIVKQCDIIDNSVIEKDGVVKPAFANKEQAYFKLWRDCRFNNRQKICVSY